MTEEKNECVPRLRFPEFARSAWHKAKLSELACIFRGGSPRPIEKFLTSSHSGLNWLKIGDIDTNSKYILSTSEKITPDGLNKTREIFPGDLLISNSMSFGRPYISLITACIHDGWIAVSNINKNTSKDFLYYFICSNYCQLYFQENAAGAVVKNLNADIIGNTIIHYPALKEQQKIADCLSSLDELIEAREQKCNALKQHKKGLMQRLFPAEGETTPRWRFPALKGKWEKKRIEDIAIEKLSNGIFNKSTQHGNIYSIINVKDMYSPIIFNEKHLQNICTHEKINKVYNGDIFFTRSSLVPSGIAHSNIYLGFSDNITFDDHLIRLRVDKNKHLPLFIYYILKTTPIRNYLTSCAKTTTMTTIGQEEIYKTILYIPSLPEQQKIADCISSLDDRIAAEEERLTALREHKKGLMQQLFPRYE